MHVLRKIKALTRHRKRSTFDICKWLFIILLVIIILVLIFAAMENNSKTNVKVLQINQKYFRDAGDGLKKFTTPQYTWLCRNFKCIKTIVNNVHKNVSLETCNMVCYMAPPLWPSPQKMTIVQRDSTLISAESIVPSYRSERKAYTPLVSVINMFLSNLKARIKSNSIVKKKPNKINVSLEINNVELDYNVNLRLDTNESYQLTISKNPDYILVIIEASTYYGFRHGLETLSQLIWYDSYEQSLRILHDVTIRDYPAFPYRGLMIDTSRNFFSIDLLKKTVDGMASVKLNVLHLHLTDAVSFPIVLPSLEALAYYGAYSSDMVYTTRDIKDLIAYARARGIRIILEVDAPSHIYEGWNHYQDEYDQKLIMCDNKILPGGQLNPDNPDNLEILQKIYEDILELTGDDEIFHIGGDEVNQQCWSKIELTEQYNSVKMAWLKYTNKILDRLKAANNNKLPKKVMLWSSPLTDQYDLYRFNADVILHFWFGNENSITRDENKIIFSTVGSWYLDCGFGAWNPTMTSSSCNPYHSWQTFYSYRPWHQYRVLSRTLGGEACLWSEQVGVDTFETRIWPRVAAFAERLWTDPNGFIEYDVYTRLDIHRERLAEKNIKSETIWPLWCTQNPKKCGFNDTI